MLTALYRPPRGAAGAAGVRAHALATGLRAAGHPVTVVCARSAGNERRVEDGVEVIPAPWVDVERRARSVGLELRDLPRPRGPAGKERNTVMREIVARATIPDRYVIWIPGAVAAARRHGRDRGVVISTGPVSAHLAGRAIVGSRPWIADVNDLWALNPHRSNGRLRDAIDVFMERHTLGAATELTTVNDAMRDEVGRRTGKPVTTIYSGFHPDDFAGLPRGSADGGRLRLLYAGALYPSQDLTPLFRVLGGMSRARGLSATDVGVTFIGRVTERAVLEAERLGVGDLVAAHEPIGRHDLLARMCAADALILPLNNSDNSALPIKIFEYIGAGRPILAWGERDSLAARVILDNGFGLVASDETDLAGYLERILARDGSMPSGDDEARARFTWEHSVETITELVARVG
jgi:glycosyltransferase involved in cell wall biosynthesis